MTKISVLTLLASTVLSGVAVAADMQVKAPIREAAVPYADWSGVYTGGAVGGAWSREKWDHDPTVFDNQALASSQLFGTSSTRMFEANALIAPPFAMDCVLSNCTTNKMSGIMAGGFAGVQKQFGNWVIGLEGSWDWLGLKKTMSASDSGIETVTRSVLVNEGTLPAFSITVPGQTAPVTSGSFVIPDQKVTVNGQDITVPGQSMTIGPQGINVTNTITIPQLAGLTIPAGSQIPVIVVSGDQSFQTTLVSTKDVTFDANGKAVWQSQLGGTLTAGEASIVTKVETAGGTVATKDTVIHVNGQDLTVKGITVTISGQTATTQPRTIQIPAMPVTLPGLGFPVLTPQRAAVTRSVSVESRIDQVADLRGKFGLTNFGFGSGVLLYATGGASIAHLQHSLSITQNVQAINANGVAVGTPRNNEFNSVSGDTRLGWVVGAGLDWKMTQNLILGVLYRHHEFPKGTIAFNDGTNSLGFGTSRVSMDSVQGRFSVLFPIQ